MKLAVCVACGIASYLRLKSGDVIQDSRPRLATLAASDLTYHMQCVAAIDSLPLFAKWLV